MVRMSGPDAVAILSQLTEGEVPLARTLKRVRFKNISLPALGSWLAADASYTGQDTVELQLTGNPALLERVLREIMQLDARLAEPGEFSYRAYRHGRLSLAEAEAVAATIAATNDAQLLAAETLRQTTLAEAAAGIVDELGTLLALVEAGIDFVDQEDVVAIPPGDLAERLQAVMQQLKSLQARSRQWSTLGALPIVAMVGPPSSGKSTLFNAMLGRPRAVADALPGTTRDVLAEPIELDEAGSKVMLVDLAGLESLQPASNEANPIEHQAQTSARDLLQRADLLLIFGDCDIATLGTSPYLQVRSHIDQRPLSDAEKLQGFCGVSGMTGEGVAELKSAIAEKLQDLAASTAAEQLVIQPRHDEALAEASSLLENALQSFDSDQHNLDLPELVAAPMRLALDVLAGLGGELVPDDVIGKVFASFCVGK